MCNVDTFYKTVIKEVACDPTCKILNKAYSRSLPPFLV